MGWAVVTGEGGNDLDLSVLELFVRCTSAPTPLAGATPNARSTLAAKVDSLARERVWNRGAYELVAKLGPCPAGVETWEPYGVDELELEGAIDPNYI